MILCVIFVFQIFRILVATEEVRSIVEISIEKVFKRTYYSVRCGRRSTVNWLLYVVYLSYSQVGRSRLVQQTEVLLLLNQHPVDCMSSYVNIWLYTVCKWINWRTRLSSSWFYQPILKYLLRLYLTQDFFPILVLSLDI